jgi:hypothetical protein
MALAGVNYFLSYQIHIEVPLYVYPGATNFNCGTRPFTPRNAQDLRRITKEILDDADATLMQKHGNLLTSNLVFRASPLFDNAALDGHATGTQGPVLVPK